MYNVSVTKPEIEIWYDQESVYAIEKSTKREATSLRILLLQYFELDLGNQSVPPRIGVIETPGIV
jgi:hypothetical protein